MSRYENSLVRNTVDNTDLSLYVPGDCEPLTFLANANGEYVVGDDVVKINDQFELPGSVSETSSSNNSTPSFSNFSPNAQNHLNYYTVYPQRHKRVNFYIGRRLDYAYVTMRVQKKMWFGWKLDKHRTLVIEPHFNNAIQSWINGFRPERQFFRKDKIDAPVIKIKGSNTLTGEIYTWTDLTGDKDYNGNLIYNDPARPYSFKCSVEKAEIVNVCLTPY